MTSRTRNLAYAGMIAGLIGCAGVQKKIDAGPESTAAPTATSTESGCKAKRTMLQSCIIEAIVKDCKTKTKDEDSFYSCTADGLDLSGRKPEQRSFAVQASKGDEVISMRFGMGVVYQTASAQINSIDDAGVELGMSMELVHVANTDDKDSVQKGTLKVGFDGAVSGDVGMFKQLEVFNLSVEKLDGGKVTVKYSTLDPSAVVLSAAGS